MASPPSNPLAAQLPIWNLSRPEPALPNSFFWTWDHSTNWMLDDPGMLNFGCHNHYLKQPETFVEDYRRVTDLAAGLGVRGIIIWGFLRDHHGGVDFARRVADHAAEAGVAIMPGVGTNYYGGVYYKGDHRFNIETFIERHPDVRSIDERGDPRPNGICPLHPRFAEWLTGGLQWLFQEFSVGGANLENGDFIVCHCPRCKKHREEGAGQEPEFWRHQYLGYDPALRAIEGQLRNKLVSWATYKGFIPGLPAELGGHQRHAYMECERPSLVDRMPQEGRCQWTLSGMVRAKALPLTAYLDDGAPAEALTSDKWPAAVRPPSAHGVGFLHQGSQWSDPPRNEQIVSTIKEACLRGYRAGLEGIGIHGEVSGVHVPYALNYLAFSHFIHWPEDSLRDFGRKTLGQVLGSEDEGEAFAELLARWDAGSLSEAQKKDVLGRAQDLRKTVASAGQGLQRWRFWHWLQQMSTGAQERHTVGIY